MANKHQQNVDSTYFIIILNYCLTTYLLFINEPIYKLLCFWHRSYHVTASSCISARGALCYFVGNKINAILLWFGHWKRPTLITLANFIKNNRILWSLTCNLDSLLVRDTGPNLPKIRISLCEDFINL